MNGWSIRRGQAGRVFQPSRPVRASLALLLVVMLMLLDLSPASAGMGTWTRVGLDGKDVAAIAVDPSSPDVLVAGSGSEILFSLDRGKSWARSELTLSQASVATIQFDPARPGVVYAGIWGFDGGENYQGLWASRDRGRTWTQRPGNLANSISFVHQDSGIIFAGGSWTRVVSKSVDYGATWRDLPLPVTDEHLSYNVSVAVHPNNPSLVLAGLWYEDDFNNTGALYRSTNGGASWSRIRMPGDARNTTAVHPEPLPVSVTNLAFGRSGTTVYALAGGPLVRSLDGGKTWRVIRDAPRWIPSGKGVMIRAGTAPESPSAISSVLANPLVDAEVLIAEREPVRVFRSTDSGKSFSQVGTTLVGSSFESFTLDQASPQTLYVATSNGLWAYTFPARAGALPATGDPMPGLLPYLLGLGTALTMLGLRLRMGGARVGHPR